MDGMCLSGSAVLVLASPLTIFMVPYVGLNKKPYVYESLKDWLIKSRPLGLVDDSGLGVITRLACGAAAGTVGQTVAYPLDVIRRRMQMVGWKDAASVVTGDGKSKAQLEYTGMIDTFRKTVRYEGFGALYKGLVPNSVKVLYYLFELHHSLAFLISMGIIITTKYLVTFTVGFDQRNNIDATVKKFSEDFQILFFRYDGRTSEWDQFEWSKHSLELGA
ncbi:hypothetical protein POM88_010434 [Heracleum sosnowskyi]|uniref:ADP,ATP carrier protein n=1 Tax=Heracleum sosnowskyi TaxID=360622 RepID=A0AAD8IUP3_9APIA|nr:hypothetical protein POM88_010434 [Heracleum sosnowskyi]